MKKIAAISVVIITCIVLGGFAVLAGCAQKQAGPGIVKTDTGMVAGSTENGLSVFRGIPYAAPPVGELRWKPPQPVQPWEGVRETKVFAASCPQPSASDPSSGDIPPAMSEDCLYLNVWTPAKSPDENLPVMVFIHGGAFGQGSGSLPLYDGAALARKGVVVVTLNYRLGALGFLAHPQLDAESPVNSSGNYGLLDQQAALRWVQNNSAVFGGDPSRVTVFGESAGASSILVHLVSPGSRGLYRQAIVESGPVWTNGTTLNIIAPRSVAEQDGEAYVKRFGFAGPDAIRRMRNLSAGDLINATPWNTSPFWLTHTLMFKPVIDGWLIPDSPDAVFSRGEQDPVPLIVGTNADEGTTLAAQANMTVAEYRNFIRDRFGTDSDTVLARYPADSSEEVQHNLERIMTDYDFTNAARMVAASMSEKNRNTYLYRFTYAIPGQPSGAFHGSELFFVFRPRAMSPDPVSARVSDTMMDLWVRFAKTGDPNGGMNLTWPQYTRAGNKYLDIGATPSVKSGY